MLICFSLSSASFLALSASICHVVLFLPLSQSSNLTCLSICSFIILILASSSDALFVCSCNESCSLLFSSSNNSQLEWTVHSWDCCFSGKEKIRQKQQCSRDSTIDQLLPMEN